MDDHRAFETQGGPLLEQEVGADHFEGPLQRDGLQAHRQVRLCFRGRGGGRQALQSHQVPHGDDGARHEGRDQGELQGGDDLLGAQGLGESALRVRHGRQGGRRRRREGGVSRGGKAVARAGDSGAHGEVAQRHLLQGRGSLRHLSKGRRHHAGRDGHAQRLVEEVHVPAQRPGRQDEVDVDERGGGDRVQGTVRAGGAAVGCGVQPAQAAAIREDGPWRGQRGQGRRAGVEQPHGQGLGWRRALQDGPRAEVAVLGGAAGRQEHRALIADSRRIVPWNAGGGWDGTRRSSPTP
mmetsp:Transcript_91636/g.256064  ORF Transcript_91636/g.256064 Transcript_91636/m.256064 type:complete len:294 (+) Transcript_91636:565-1446(+)